MRTRKPLTDEDGEVRELLMEDIRRFRPMAEGIPPALAAKLGIRHRGQQKAPTKQRTTIRLSPDVLSRFRATGAGWQSRINTALREWLDSRPAK